MAFHLDIFTQQLNKSGEQLCGDTVQVRKDEQGSIVILSDGLGSGVKANILSTLTARILMEMLHADAPLDETVRTVIGTLPICQVRHLAYATFTAAKIDHATGRFRIVNFDNPQVLWLSRHEIKNPPRQFKDVLGRRVAVMEGSLEEDDCLAMFSDGVLHAGMGKAMNLGWDWKAVARYTQESAKHFAGSSRAIAGRVMRHVWELYGGVVGDDCSFAALLARQRRSLAMFTGPPLDPANDERIVSRFLALPGKHIVCGGTTGNIVARYLDEEPDVLMESMRPEVPPIARLRELDLLTEGILTMSKALKRLRDALSGHALPDDTSGDVLLAKELLFADVIHIILGKRINDCYQNPSLPESLSLRRNLVSDLVTVLEGAGKKVILETC